MRLREHTQLYLDTHLMGLTAGIPGVEHHELPEYLDSMERLRSERPATWPTRSTRCLGRSPRSCSAAVRHGDPRWCPPGARARCRCSASRRRRAAANAETRSIALLDQQAETPTACSATSSTSATEPAAGEGGAHLRPRRRAPRAPRRAVRRSSKPSARTVARQPRADLASAWILFAAGYAGRSRGRSTPRVPVTDGRRRRPRPHARRPAQRQLAELAFNLAWFARSLRAVRRLVWLTDYANEATPRYARLTSSRRQAPLRRWHPVRGRRRSPTRAS